MRVSVIIPAFNCGAYLYEAVRSVLSQTHSAQEIIVVDDGSSDDTPAIAREFGDAIEYVRTVNQGAAAARNVGLARTRGECVAFLDADDAWYPHKLETQIRVFEAHPEVQAVCCDFDLVDQQGTTMVERFVKGKYRVFSAYGLDWPDIFPSRAVIRSATDEVMLFYGEALAGLFCGNFVNTSSVLLRRDAINHAGGFTAGRRTQEDYELWLKVAASGAVAYVDTPLLLFRRRMNQLTSDDQRLQVIRDTAEVVSGFAETARLRVGERIVSERLADLYRMLAKALLGLGDGRAARQALVRAYEEHGWDRRTALLYAWSCVPAPVAEGVRRRVHWIRRRNSK